tara:strand:- start:5353 stop:5547 length:195 start_codon:yes stop_codon:yes gene_type:complete
MKNPDLRPGFSVFKVAFHTTGAACRTCVRETAARQSSQPRHWNYGKVLLEMPSASAYTRFRLRL